MLQADEAAIDEEIASTLHVGVATVARIRKPFGEGSLEWALTQRHRPGGEPKLVGKQEAYLIALPDLNGLSPEQCRGYGKKVNSNDAEVYIPHHVARNTGGQLC